MKKRWIPTGLELYDAPQEKTLYPKRERMKRARFLSRLRRQVRQSRDVIAYCAERKREERKAKKARKR